MYLVAWNAIIHAVIQNKAGASLELDPAAATHPQDSLMHEGVSPWTDPLELLQTFANALPAPTNRRQVNAHLDSNIELFIWSDSFVNILETKTRRYNAW